MSVSIREANPDDAGIIHEFILALAEYEKLAHRVSATQDDIKRDLFGDNPRIYCDIAEVDGKPVGFALWYYTYSTFRGHHGLWLEDLFVDPEARGLGAGKALMVHLAARCRDEGLVRFEWWVLDWNTPSFDFYMSLGAVMQDEWRVCRLDGTALEKLALAC